MDRRTFFGTTIGALIASVIPAKAKVKGDSWNEDILTGLEVGDRRVHRRSWEHWDGVTWVPSGEERCTGSSDGFCHPRHHYHPNGYRNATCPLPDNRYPSALWDKNGVQKNSEWDAMVKNGI